MTVNTIHHIATICSDKDEWPKGIDTMCEAMEKERVMAAEQTTLILLLNLMDSQKWNAERAMTALGIPASEKPLYARSVEYAISQRKTHVPATT